MKFWGQLSADRRPLQLQWLSLILPKEHLLRAIHVSFFLPLIFLVACASNSRTGSRPPAEVLENLARNGEKRVAVSGTILLTTEQEGRSVTAPGVLLVEWPDKLRLEVQNPVGGILALLVLNGDRFWLYEDRRPALLTGPIRELPSGLMPVLSGNDLVRLFLARPEFSRLSSGTLSGRQAVMDAPGLRETVVWSEGAPQPTEWTRQPSGQTASAAKYEDYEFKDGLHYPTKIYLSGPGPEGEERRILIAWKDWEPRVSKEKKLFQIPQQQSFGRKIKALP